MLSSPLIVLLGTALAAMAVPLDTVPLPDQVPDAALWRRADVECPITERSPFIHPSSVAVGHHSDRFLINDDGNATIAAHRSLETLFHFTLDPWDILHHADGAPRMCAVQFRLPWCSELPAGYPCFTWSGMMQQELGGGGMRFSLVYDSHAGRPAVPGQQVSGGGWEAVDGVVQLMPGEPVFVGTFPCLVDGDRTDKRNVSFVAAAEENWSLDFAQAGVGRQKGVAAEMGVGAFVVGCGSDTERGPGW